MILCARACFVCALTWEIRSKYVGFCMWGGFHAKGFSEVVRQPTTTESGQDLGICLCKLILWVKRKKKLMETLTWRKQGIFKTSAIQTTSLQFRDPFRNGQVENWFIPLAWDFLTFTLLVWNLHYFFYEISSALPNTWIHQPVIAFPCSSFCWVLS